MGGKNTTGKKYVLIKPPFKVSRNFPKGICQVKKRLFKKIY